MNKLAIGVIIAISVVTLASLRTYSSTAATESWVKAYVSTNTVQTSAISNSVALVTKNQADGMTSVLYILETDDSENAVQRASDALVTSITPIANAMAAGSVQFSK